MFLLLRNFNLQECIIWREYNCRETMFFLNPISMHICLSSEALSHYFTVGNYCKEQINSQLEGYFCTCESGWTGVNCDTNIDECLSNPCFNGGICFDKVPFFKCHCLPGFTGKHWITVDLFHHFHY